MLSLLKTFGKGVLYVLGLPFFILALVVFAVFGILAFSFQVIKSIILFFTGAKFFPELPEDKELRLLKERQSSSMNYENETVKEEEPVIVPLAEEEPQKEEGQSAPVFDEKPQFQSVESACFNEPVKEETVQEQSILTDVLKANEPDVNETPKEEPKEETVLETAEPKLDEDDLVEELETYVPRSSNYSASEDDDDGDDGVDIIDYDYKG